MANPGIETGLVREKGDSIRARNGVAVCPQDYTTLWKWITFAWMTPVTKQTELSKEEDIWNLPPSIATRAVYSKYSEIGKSFYPDGKITLSRFFWHWWRANSLDIIVEFIFSFAGVFLDFSGPLFLKLILDCISSFSQVSLTPIELRRLRAQAITYALLYFILKIIKSTLDLLHLWHGRRAGIRTRNEIMVWIYEKALRRREVLAPATTAGEKKDNKNGAETPKSEPKSGTATANDKSVKVDEQAKKEEEKRKKEEEEAKEKGSAADLGKVVNLMSTDAGTLEMGILMAHIFYVCLFSLVPFILPSSILIGFH